jgi:hypothetical protein
MVVKASTLYSDMRIYKLDESNPGGGNSMGGVANGWEETAIDEERRVR